jgi:hypothetical protein
MESFIPLCSTSENAGEVKMSMAPTVIGVGTFIEQEAVKLDLIRLHQLRYPYGHDESLIRKNFLDFSSADDDFEPICLKGKYWELIKLDIISALKT